MLIPGSSPLARGLLYLAELKNVDPRIIPARAGFTRNCLHTSHGSRDHPRSRGVYGEHLRETIVREGSSPLARGLPADYTGDVGVSWIIPARAGFTGEASNVSATNEDHPRSRGVYASNSSPVSLSYGSSPLARGLRHECNFIIRRPRIIPARAGFTLFVAVRRIQLKDHPRSRGVYWSASPSWN